MRKLRVVLVALVLLGFGVLALPSRGESPAFRERDLWRQDITTTANLLTSSLTPLTRGVVSTPTVGSTTYRFLIGVDPAAAASVVYLRVTNVAAGTSINFALNSAEPLVPGNAYTFTFNASASYTYNFRVGTNTTIGILSLDRVDSGGN
jgi:hypothetical protein